MFAELNNVITQFVVSTFDSGSTYVAGDRAVFGSIVYIRKTTPATPIGVGLTFSANSTLNNKTDSLTFNQTIFVDGTLGDLSVLGFNNNQNVGTPGSPLSFQVTRFYREQPALALAQKITNWSGQLNNDGVLEAVFDSGTIELYNADGSDITANPTLSGNNFSITIASTQPTKTLTSGNPDVDTDHWTATIELADTDSLLDTENTILSGLPSVTYETIGPVGKYNIAATAKFINDTGTTLNINTELSRVIPHRPTEIGSGTAFLVKGIVNYGVEKGNAGEGVYTNGLGLYFPELGALWYNGSLGGAVGNCSFGLDGGTLNLYGGTIAGGITFTPNSASTINVYRDTRIIADQKGPNEGQEPIIRWNNVTIINHDGASLSLDSVSVSITKNSGDADFSANLVGKGVGVWIQGLLNCSNTNPNGNYTTIFDSSAKGKDVDIAPYTDAPQTARHAVCVIRNWETGSDNNINGGETGATDQNSGVYFMAVQDIETNIKSLATSDDITGVIFINGKNRFSDLLAPIEEVEGDGIDYFDDDAIIKYTIKYDGAITDFNSTGGYAGGVLLPDTGLKAIVQYTHQLNYVDGTARARGTQDVGAWKKAHCTESGVVGQDDFVKVNWSFGFIPTVETIILQDQKVVTIVENLTDSIVTTVTEAEAKTLSDNATELSWTANALTLTEVITSDNLVNIAHYRKQFDSSHRDLPNIESLAFDADGSVLDLNVLTTVGITGNGEIQVGGKHTTIEHDVSLNCAKFTGTVKTLKAPILTNLDTNPGEFEIYDGSFTTTGDFVFTPHTDGDVSKLTIVVKANTELTIYNKVAVDFLSIDISASGATVVFPLAATRLDISLSVLPEGSTYAIYNDGVLHTSGTVSSNQADLQLSNDVNDGRVHSTSLGGLWHIAYVDSDKRCTFKGVTVTETTSSDVIAEFELIPTEFTVAFEVPSVDTSGRTLTVKASDTSVQPTDEDTCLVTGGTWDGSLCTGATRAEFDISGCPVSDWADETQSSVLVANARNSIAYVTAVNRQVATNSIPTNGSIITFDIVRPRSNGADWKTGRYFIFDTEAGTQETSGWYEVEDLESFSQGVRTPRQLTLLASSIDSNGAAQVQSQVRLLVSAEEVSAKTTEAVKELTDPIQAIVSKTQNAIGWLVQTGSKFLGIKPRPADYDNNNNYKDNT